MNYAIIFAGGTGIRMSTAAKPKQFLELHGKPVLIYTLEHFENHKDIDGIVIVCLKSWIDELKVLLKRYDINKAGIIVAGGKTGSESIYNGLKAAEAVCSDDDIVLIHDGVRPLICEKLISDNIAKVIECGTAITVGSTIESVVRSRNGDDIDSVPPRDEVLFAKAPQSFRYKMIWDLYQKAHAEGIATIDSAHLCSVYGVHMHAVKSTPYNMKITEPHDYYIFRALYEAMENQQILGY